MAGGHSPPSHPHKSARHGALVCAIIVGVFVAVVVCAALLHGCTSAPPTTPTVPGGRAGVAATAPATQAAGHVTAVIISVHDGDTCTAYVTFDDPLLNAKGTVLRHVRIAGINAPELSTQAGKDARAIQTLTQRFVQIAFDPVRDFG